MRVAVSGSAQASAIHPSRPKYRHRQNLIFGRLLSDGMPWIEGVEYLGLRVDSLPRAEYRCQPVEQLGLDSFEIAGLNEGDE